MQHTGNIFFVFQSNKDFVSGKTAFPVGWGQRAIQKATFVFLICFPVAIIALNILGSKGLLIFLLPFIAAALTYAYYLNISIRCKQRGDGAFVRAEISNIEWFSPWDDQIRCKVTASVPTSWGHKEIQARGTASQDSYNAEEFCLVWILSDDEMYVM